MRNSRQSVRSKSPCPAAHRRTPIAPPFFSAMYAESPSPAAARPPRNDPDRKSNAGTTPDPWVACATIEYGGDRTLAWSVRQQVVACPPDARGRVEDRL